jgi:hypothetical protein
VIVDFGYVRHIESIHLCSNEIVLEGKWSDMKLNVRYDKIKSIEVEVV